ncbi:MAG: ATP-binding protein [Proteobacteria bacterium]|nr:ATP-binding protein [Pseudomonadota bacterium]
MDRRTNPYAPGAGLQPPELAGRDRFIEDAAIDMDRLLDGRPNRGMLLLGLRGAGKTVLLNRLYQMATARGIHTAKIEAPEGGTLPQLLAPELRRILYGLDLKTAAGSRLRQAVSVLRNFVGAFKVKAGEIEFGIEPAPGRADTGSLEHDLPDLFAAVAEAANERHSAIILFIDEVQYLSSKELGALIVGCHEMAQANLPFLLMGAGLPQLAALAGNAKSYAERLFNYPQIGPLGFEAARNALVHPAQHQGVSFDDDAVAEILRVTEGYPYFLQEWGFQVWNAAADNRIRRTDVQRMTPVVIAHLDANFFRVRFDRLTALQQKYLRAMAQLGPGPYRTRDIAAELGVAAAAVATIRQQLIDKGMAWSQRHGETAFTVPLFDSFMKRQIPVFEKHKPKRRKKKRQ